MDKNTCPNCQSREVQQLKNDLHKCKESQKSKDRKIKALDKKVFILMIIAVGIGAIFGKEALDAIVEWIDSITNFSSGTNHLISDGVITPAPGTLALFAIAPFLGPSRKRK
tara:strand:- start:244 stop:576 length:333 start_codon:yes stop_codon:yes gene_type:complete